MTELIIEEETSVSQLTAKNSTKDDKYLINVEPSPTQSDNNNLSLVLCD